MLSDRILSPQEVGGTLHHSLAATSIKCSLTAFIPASREVPPCASPCCRILFSHVLPPRRPSCFVYPYLHVRTMIDEARLMLGSMFMPSIARAHLMATIVVACNALVSPPLHPSCVACPGENFCSQHMQLLQNYEAVHSTWSLELPLKSFVRIRFPLLPSKDQLCDKLCFSVDVA